MVFIKRVQLIVEGDVQDVGFRAKVKRIGTRMGLKGKVKNLKDGKVEIYCDGEREDIVKKFIEAINIKSDPDDIFSINVTNIIASWEAEEGFEEEGGYKSPGKKFDNFEIDYGEVELSASEKTNLERLEIGSLLMLDLKKEIGRGFSSTHSDFKELDKKYDVVSQELKSINGNISKLDKNVAKLVGHLGTIIDTVIKNKKS